MKDNHYLRYRLLADASLAAAEGQSDDQILNSALNRAIEVIGLVTGSVRIVDESGKVASFQVAGRDEFVEMMRQIEEKMLSVLRDDFAVRSSFLTFEQDGLFSLFTYPLRIEGRILGTISGITPGERSLAAEEEFIKAVSSVLALVLTRGKAEGQAAADIISRAKAEAVVETAVTVNHEINNPLTAVLGNIQLLLLNADNLPADIRNKLKAVEESALKIKEVTQNLMNVIEPSVIEYTTGLKMIDLNTSVIRKTLEEKDKEDSESSAQ